jgi:hypothetical protein
MRAEQQITPNFKEDFKRAKGKKEKMSLILLTLIQLEKSNTHATMNLED